MSGSGLKEVRELIGHNAILMTDRYAYLRLAHKSLHRERSAQHTTLVTMWYKLANPEEKSRLEKILTCLNY
jgi:hypothetical protein